MAWTAVRGGRILMPKANTGRAAFAAFFLFVGGIGLVTQGEKLGVPSGVAAIIKASVPLWVVLLEFLRPKGEKPGGIVLVGLVVGAAGVVMLVLPRLSGAVNSGGTLGTSLLLISALLFAIGSIFVAAYPSLTKALRAS